MTSPYDCLNSLMNETSHKEIECRAYLENTKEKLVKNPPDRFIRFEPEYRGHTSDSDLIITCEAVNDAGIRCIEAYIWEVKSPQCYIFEYDNNNRVKPTKDLISAENQLLHYYEEYKKSETFKQDFSISSSDNIHTGGIIIGQKDRLIKPNSRYNSEEKKNSLYTRAINCRKEHFYKASRIEFIIWNRILDLLSSDQPVRQTPDQVLAISSKSNNFDIGINDSTN
jgi:hypothetical protein